MWRRLELTWFCYNPSCFIMYIMIISILNKICVRKGKRFVSKQRSPSASRSVKGYDTKLITVKWPISFEDKNENFVAAVRKWEILAATKLKTSCSDKKETGAHTTFPRSIKRVTRKFLEVSGSFALAVYTLETDYPSEMSYPLDNSLQTDNTS